MKIKQLLIVCLLVLLLMGCGNTDEPTSQTPTAVNSGVTTSSTGADATPESDAAYPVPETQQEQTPGYTVPQATIEGLSPTIPDPDVIFPATDPETGVIGGVLAREITDEGYVPVQPRALILGRIIENNLGEQALISVAENAQRAELFATGVFLFNQVPPGAYALVIDLGFTAFPLVDENGQQILLDIEGGMAVDLGQILVEVPES